MGQVITLLKRAIFGGAPTLEQIAHDRVLHLLRGRINNEKLAQAQARAGRLIRAGYDIDTAVNRATAWARCATSPFPSPPNAA